MAGSATNYAGCWYLELVDANRVQLRCGVNACREPWRPGAAVPSTGTSKQTLTLITQISPIPQKLSVRKSAA